MSITAYSTTNLNRPEGSPSGPCDCHGIPAGGGTDQVLKKNSATDYDVSWKDEAEDTSSTQNTITRLVSLLVENSTLDAFAIAINALPTFEIAANEVFKFAMSIPDPQNPVYRAIYFVELKDIGKGTYGIAGTQLTDNNIFISGVRRLAPEFVEDLPTTQTINLGDVGSNDIVTAFNAHTFLGSQSPVQEQSQGYVLVSAIISGILKKYLFTGIGGNYGVGGDKTAVLADFGFFPEDVESPTDLSLYQLKTEKGTANGYPALDANALLPIANHNVEGAIAASASQPTPLDANIFGFLNASGQLVRTTFAGIIATLQTAFDLVYLKISDLKEEKIKGTAKIVLTSTGAQTLNFNTYAHGHFNLTSAGSLTITDPTLAVGETVVRSFKVKNNGFAFTIPTVISDKMDDDIDVDMENTITINYVQLAVGNLDLTVFIHKI